MREAIETASARYLVAGRWAHGFARGKMSGDPAYRRVLELIDCDEGTFVDIGCGEGHLLALVRALHPGLSLVGLDHDASRVETARVVLGEEARIQLHLGDVRDFELPEAQLIACLDVLHYMTPEEQDTLLSRFAVALAAGGVLLIRDGRSEAGFASTITRWSEQLAVAFGRHKGDGVFFRPAEDTRATLEAAGLRVELSDCSEGTPFANMLWVGRKEGS
ncbi:MAG TPA: class I SAM-dependent methyltransferase [Myxococcota bacterium]|jgi:SAM-dependent methyltransferase|nr:class I SAM-dependent methyltransferase [Myxococcota bacterium]